MFIVVLAGLILGAFSYEWQSGPAGMAAPMFGTAAMTLLPAAVAAVVMIYCGVKAQRHASADARPGRWSAPAVYARGTHAVSALSILSYLASLDVFGWVTVPAKAHVAGWELPARAIIAAPFLISVILAWIPLHYAERHVRLSTPTLGQQLSFNIRQYILTLVVPMAMVLAALDAGRLMPAAVQKAFRSDEARAAAAGAAILGGYTLAPVVLVRVWNTSRMPRGALRERLSELCRRAGVRFRDIRIWETPGLYFLNAAVMGITWRVRYVVISRVLLEAMPQTQVEAVFAHELAHAKRHHIGLYLLFAADFMLLADVFDALVAGPLGRMAGLGDPWVTPGGIGVASAAFALYWGVGFGYLSRTFEREADLFGAEMTGNNDVSASALEAIAGLSGASPAARSWRHGSILSRVAFLRAAAADRAVKDRFVWRAMFLKVLLVTTAAVSLAGMFLLAHLPLWR
jgi:STE24 endopeptidase